LGGSITKEELLKKVEIGEKFHLIDVRGSDEYQKEHIVGAVHLLIAEMKRERLEDLFAKQDLIVTYSEDIHCPAKNIAADKMREVGFANVFAYQGSWKEWKDAGYPTERGDF
jgi:rhodanese-related sulfurtransferase